MSTLKKNENLTLEAHVDNRFHLDLLNAPHKTANNHEVLLKLQSLFQTEDIKEQLDILKKVCSGLKNTDDGQKEEKKCLEILANLYLNCKMKHPVKRMLASTFQNFQNCVKILLKSFLVEQVLLKQSLCLQEQNRDVDGLRMNVDIISGLMENFIFGEKCVNAMAVSVLGFLSEVLSRLIDLYSLEMSPMQQNVIMHHCLATVNTTNRMLQKCQSKLKQAFDEDRPKIEDISAAMISSNIKIILQDSFMLDVRCSCSMNIVLLLRLNYQQSTVLQLLKYVFRLIPVGEEDIPGFLQQTGIMSLSSQQLVSLSSQLCLYNGLLSLLELSDLGLEYENGKCLLTDFFLEKFLSLGNSCEDTSGKLLAAKSTTLWTIRASSCIEAGVISPTLIRRLEGSDPLLQSILQYVWNAWEDPVDHIRINAIELFQNILKVHKLAVSTDIANDKFIQDLCKSLLFEISWSCKGKYRTLSALVMYTGASYFLHLNPDVPWDILNQMKEQTLSCHACDLYEKISAEHYLELCSNNTDDKDDKPVSSINWFTRWVDPVIKVLSGTKKTHKIQVIEYLLPKLLKSGRGTLEYMITQLTEDSLTQDDIDIHDMSGHVGALIMCLRRARVMGLLKQGHVKSESDELLYGVVSKHVIKQALNNSEDQVRLDAVALLCENHKTSELIVKLEFDLVRYFIPWNLNNQSPSFRQLLVSHLKKFLNRYKESEGVLLRQLKKHKDNSALEYTKTCDCLSYYQEFLSWLVQHLFHCLYPGSAFARRTTCLALLSLMVDTFGTVTSADKKHTSFCISDYLCRSNVQVLMECLTDTFEENKMEAFKIIKYCTNNGLSIKDPVELTKLLQVSLQLAGSTRPQDSTTGAYLFKVILLQTDVYNILQTQSMDIIKPYLMTDKFNEIHLPSVENNQSGRSLLLLQILLSCLQDQLEVAKNNLIMAAANRPLYPTLHCIRYLLCDVNLRNIPGSQFSHWKTFINALLTCTLEISEVVSPVVHNSSPEGNVPIEAIKESGAKLESILKSGEEENSLMLEAEKSKETVMLMPEYLVVCCWRSIKEVSLLLGQLTVTSPITDPSQTNTATGLLSFQQILVIGEYYTKQLLESYHRGAFELAYAGFVKMCDMLWKSNMSDLHQLPAMWMSNLMKDIKSTDGSSKLCATRRSAGVPFYVQAIVTTEPTLTGRICFKLVMTELLNLAMAGYEDTSNLVDSQVHALNILRMLFRDARLGDDVSPYIADGVKASVLGFQSPFWAVRNSATLLLSALMTRIFGVKRSKDETNMSKKNCQTGRAFFHRYPTLYKFMLDKLQSVTENISGDDGVLHLHPALYPLLMILGRLFPSPMEGADTSLNLASFIPHIIRCSSSPVLKTRIMAGKALHPLVHKDQLMSVFETIFHQLPMSRDKTCSQSHIHGLLLQIQHLINIIPTVGDSLKQSTWTKIISFWSQKLWLISRENPCYITRQEALKITFDIIQNSCVETNKELISSIQNKLLTILHSERDMFQCQGHVYIPGFSDFLSFIGTITIAMCLKGDNSVIIDGNLTHFEIESFLLLLLNSTCYEVRIMSLRFVKLFFKMENEDEEEQSDPSVDEDIYRMITKCDKKYKDMVCSSTGILGKCLQMAMEEECHHECQYEVFQVLKDHPLLQDTVWPFSGDATTPYKVLTRCMEIIHVNTRDEVKSSVIEFTGCVVCHLLNSYKKGVYDITIDQVHKLLSDWIKILHQYSRTEQSEDLQISCVNVIVKNTKLLLEDTDSVIGDYKFSFWSILVDLLQEDDLEVKVIAANVLTKFSTEPKVTVHPLLALDMVIDVMVRLHGVTSVKACMNVMVNWLNGQDTDTNVQDERLFDRGEMNTYREDVIVIQLIIRHLVGFTFKLWDLQQQHQNSDVLRTDLSSEEETNRKQQKYTDTQVKSDSLCQLGQKLANLPLTDGSRRLASCHDCTIIKKDCVKGVSCQPDIDIDVLRQLCVIFSNHYPNDVFTDSLENQIRNVTDRVYTNPLKDDSNTISNIFCDFLMVQEKKLFCDTDLSHMSPLNESGSYQCLVLDIYKMLIAIHLCCSIKCDAVKHLCDDMFTRLHVIFSKTDVLSNSLIAPLLTRTMKDGGFTRQKKTKLKGRNNKRKSRNDRNSGNKRQGGVSFNWIFNKNIQGCFQKRFQYIKRQIDPKPKFRI